MTEDIIQKLPAPATGHRVESGPIQFGEDWPGAFFRGDDAAHHAHMLSEVLRFLKDNESMMMIRGVDILCLLHVKSLIDSFNAPNLQPQPGEANDQ